MSKLSNMIGLAKKVLDSQNGQQQQQGAPQSGSTGQRSWQSTLRDVANAVSGQNQQQGQGQGYPGQQQGYPGQQQGYPPAPQGYPAGQQGYPGQQPGYPGAPQGYPGQQQGYPAQQGYPGAHGPADADRQAIARYDYLMQTADPHQVERIHAEAFARLTPAQRHAVMQRMQTELPQHEQPRSADPVELSRAAGRSEARRPGSMRSVLAKVGKGGAVAGVAVGAVGILGAVAAGAVVSSVAGPLLENAANLGVDFESLAAGVDIEGLTAAAGEFGTGALGEAAAGFEEYGTGAIDQAAAGIEGYGADALGQATTGVEDFAGSAEGAVSGVGDQVSGVGDQVSEAGQGLSDIAEKFDPRNFF
ncbi:cation-transporting ATPase [Promicromonospora sukumoe]|uniref:cation-transporting ATPase n=1 Tax=Promicromonospora sukumoe TaxID=88382 RepID=UPI0037CC1753